jgi:hypothetical protein
MTFTTTTGKKGLLVHPDDLAVGKHYAVYGVKNSPAETHPIFGQAFKLKALNLPFVVGTLVSDPAHPPVTLDVRYQDFMRVTADFVKAQAPPRVSDAD